MGKGFKDRTFTPRCNCGGPCNACLLRCHCGEHWHHEDQAKAMEEARLHNKGKYHTKEWKESRVKEDA